MLDYKQTHPCRGAFSSGRIIATVCACTLAGYDGEVQYYDIPLRMRYRERLLAMLRLQVSNLLDALTRKLRMRALAAYTAGLTAAAAAGNETFAEAASRQVTVLRSHPPLSPEPSPLQA